MAHKRRNTKPWATGDSRMRFPISSLIMICIAGILLFLFVIFNYAYMGPGGLKEEMSQAANKTLSGKWLSNFNNQKEEFTAMFGMGCVLCIGLAVVFFILDVLGDRREPY